MRYSPNILYYMQLYKKYWFLMVFLIVAAMLFAAVKASRQPVTYKSVVTVLLPQRESQISSFGRVLGVDIGDSSQDVIFSILASRRMREDIYEYFNVKDKPGFWWKSLSYRTTGGFSVAVIGADPELTKEIANFSVKHLDELYTELNIGASRQKQIITILDPAITGTPQKRPILKKVLFAGLFSFLICSLFVFSIDYLKRLKP